MVHWNGMGWMIRRSRVFSGLWRMSSCGVVRVVRIVNES